MLNAFVTSVAAVVVVLGIMILIHELGHYLAAKLFGVRVEVFSIGFGKRLFGFRRGDTDYRLSAIPLGGYVKMSGENPTDSHSGDPAEFSSHPRWQRLIIAAAGPTANILLAIVLLTGVFMVHYERPLYRDEPAVIGHVRQDSPAARAGLQPGDRLARIDDIQNPTWEDVELKTLLSPNQPLDIAVQRDGKLLPATVVPHSTAPDQPPLVGWLPDQDLVVARVEPGLPAHAAGLQPGDEIVAVKGRPVRSMVALQDLIQQSRDNPIEVTVLRDGQQLRLTTTPVLSQRQLAPVLGARDDAAPEERYIIGFQSVDPVRVQQLPLGAALAQSVETNKRYSLLIFELVQKMVQGKISMKQIEGPIGIARVSGQAARMEGWMPLLTLMAIISLNLGIFNLFPIPILDGGVILLLLIESVLRRDISLQVKERIYQFGFVFLILFAALVIYNDLAKMIPGLLQ